MWILFRSRFSLVPYKSAGAQALSKWSPRKAGPAGPA